MSRISIIFSVTLLIFSMTGCALISSGGPTGVPTITSVTPSSAPAGTSGLVATVSGSSFTTGLVVLVNGSPRTTTYVNKNQLKVALTATDLATPATLLLAAQGVTTAPKPNGNPHSLSTLSTQTTTASTTTASTTTASTTTLSNSVSFNVTTPSPLAVATTVIAGGEQSTAYNASLAATGGVAPYSWSISSGSLPSGLTLNSSTGAISGVPTATGTFGFGVQVRDSSATTNSASATLSMPVVAPLQIATATLPTPQLQASYGATLIPSGGASPYAWSVAAGTLPAGLSLNALTGTITGTPTASGTYTFTVRVDNSSPVVQSALAVYSQTVAGGSGSALQVSTTSLPGGQAQSSYSGSLTATGGTAPYSWSIISGLLPAGLSLNSATGQISGTPTSATNASFGVQVKDSSSISQTATSSLSIAILAALQIATTSIPNPQLNTPYSANLVVNGGAAPYAWTIASGTLPPGLALGSANGVISGTPSTSGVYVFTAQVSDAPTTSQVASQAFVIDVTGLQITTSALPATQPNSSYNATLTATGGTGPYTWAISSGSLPQGLSLNPSSGLISGTTSATTGNFSLIAQVTDSESPAATASQPFSIDVSALGAGKDWPVHAGGSIQAAINSASIGDTITIDAGVTFTPQVLALPFKSGCTSGSYVTIRSSNYGSLPSGRVQPSDAVNMPKIVRTGPDAGGLFYLAPGTNGGCYYLLGLEITTDAVNQLAYPLVSFQDTGSSHLVVDRCYIHSAEYPNNTVAPFNSSIGLGGVLSDGSDVTVENSFIAGMWGLPLGAAAGSTMTQSSAILSDVGPCNPCLWTNNYLEGGYSHIQMGGAPQAGTVGGTVVASPAPTTTSAALTSVSGLAVNMPVALQVPWNSAYCKRGVTASCWGDGVIQSISGNTITFSPLRGELPDGTPVNTAAPAIGGNAIWSGTQLSGVTITRNWMRFNYAFEHWLRFVSGNGNHDKGYMEIKNGNILDIEANVFGEYGGWPSVFGLGNEQNQVGDSPFATQSNITIKNNWLRGFKECSYFGDSVGGGYLGFLNTASDNITITNNLCEAPDTTAIDSMPASAFVFGVGKHVTYTHNTVLTGYNNTYSGGVMTYDQSPIAAYGHAWSPVVVFKDNLVGWGNYGFACSAGAIANCWGAYTESNNLFPLCSASGCSSPSNPVADGTFPHSKAVNNWSSIQFTNAASHVWSLTSSSPGFQGASDGTDIGVNWAQLMAALSGVVPN